MGSARSKFALQKQTQTRNRYQNNQQTRHKQHHSHYQSKITKPQHTTSPSSLQAMGRTQSNPRIKTNVYTNHKRTQRTHTKQHKYNMCHSLFGHVSAHIGMFQPKFGACFSPHRQSNIGHVSAHASPTSGIVQPTFGACFSPMQHAHARADLFF